ncbi:MAG: caspase family protein, partial [bacterium]
MFRSEIMVGARGTKVTIVATDRQGGRAERVFTLEPGTREASAEVARPPALAIDFGRYFALVIGNDRYRNPEVHDLATARADARELGALLKRKFGFEVTTLLDATRYDILSALNTLRGELTEKDNLLVFYAGHGELDRANSRGHWLPVDAEPQSTANWISNVDLTDLLNAMSARHIIVVADSCYSGALTRSSLARLEAGMTKEARLAWMRGMVGKKSRTALTSGGIAPVLDSGGGDHSIFTKALLTVLGETEDAIEGQRVFQEISARVAWAAEAQQFEQLPQYAPIKYAGHESGDFFFVPRG